jgi:hypothetical protein
MRKSHVPTVDVDEEEKKVGNRRKQQSAYTYSMLSSCSIYLSGLNHVLEGSFGLGPSSGF